MTTTKAQLQAARLNAIETILQEAGGCPLNTKDLASRMASRLGQAPITLRKWLASLSVDDPEAHDKYHLSRGTRGAKLWGFSKLWSHPDVRPMDLNIATI